MAEPGEIEKGPPKGVPGGTHVLRPKSRLEDPLSDAEKAKYAAVVGAEPRPAPGPRPPGPWRALVLEDDPGMRTLIATVLQHWGVEVAEAAHGTEALRWLARHPADILVADLMLPGLDGYEVIRGARLYLGLKNLRVIAVTAMEGDKAETAALETGGDTFLRKPFSIDRLAAHLRVAMRGLVRSSDNGPPQPG